MTPSTTTVDLNVGYPNIATVVHAVQGDNQSRILTANLYDGGIAWTPPAGAVGVIKFHTPLGTSGMYDTDEEGSTAVTWTGNVATLRIVQNALAVAGDVPMQLSFYDDQGAVITSFLWETLVQPSVLTDTQFMQTDYYNILSQQISAILTAIADIPEPATSAPLMDGTAAVGTQNTFARGDHRHPTDTSRAPTNHASTGTSYGAGNASNYGHVKLSDSTSSTSGTSGGTAATPSAVKTAYDKANSKPDLSSTTPKMDGTAAVGTGTTAARADHVHPSDTSRVPTTRKVNNKALSADITLSSDDIGDDSGAGGTNVKASLAALKGSLNTINFANPTVITSSGENLNNYTTGGVWYFTDAAAPTNRPSDAGNYGFLVVMNGGTNSRLEQLWVDSGNNNLYYRKNNATSISWSNWKRVVTEDELTTTSVQATNVRENATITIKKAGKVVTVQANIGDNAVAHQTASTSWQTLGYVPAGYRPSTAIFAVCFLRNVSAPTQLVASYGRVATDGVIQVWNSAREGIVNMALTVIYLLD